MSEDPERAHRRPRNIFTVQVDEEDATEVDIDLDFYDLLRGQEVRAVMRSAAAAVQSGEYDFARRTLLSFVDSTRPKTAREEQKLERYRKWVKAGKPAPFWEWKE